MCGTPPPTRTFSCGAEPAAAGFSLNPGYTPSGGPGAAAAEVKAGRLVVAMASYRASLMLMDKDM